MPYPQLQENQFHMLVADSEYVEMHGHDFLEFSYVLRGTLEHQIDGQTSLVQAGDFFIVDYGTQHAYHAVTQEPVAVFNFLFYPAFADRSLAGQHSFREVANSYLLRFNYSSLVSSPTGKTLHDTSGRIRTIITEMQTEYERQQAGYIECIRCLFLQMLIRIMRKIEKSEPQPVCSDMVADIVAQVRADYAQPLTLSALAEKYNYSLAHLSKKFTREMQMGFSAFLQRVRVEQSCRLLETTSLSVSQIAEQVGYNDVRFFNRVFRTVLQMTPREFRRLSC